MGAAIALNSASLARALHDRAVPYANALLGRVLPLYVGLRRKSRPRRRHGLAAPLVVSVTSYARRFPTLPLTLKCLLSQSVAADRVVLWVGEEDAKCLTSDIVALQSDGLTIRVCEDLGPYTKIIPALVAYPGHYIATADDDVYYGATWLEQLVSHERGSREVLCHRAHRIRLGADGLPLPYRSWEMETRYARPSALIFPTGNGGVLYPPGTLDPEVVNTQLFRSICPDADDIWLYWMMRRSGAVARRIGSSRFYPTWKGTQAVALWQRNVAGGGNDRCIKAMTARFGFPHAERPSRMRERPHLHAMEERRAQRRKRLPF